MKIPLFIINCKNYLEVAGDGALRLAKIAEEVAKELDIEIIVAPPTPDLALISKSVSIPIIAQHLDNKPHGSTTGSIIPEIAKVSGVIGSLLNHSEKRIGQSEIEALVARLHSLDLISIVCARTPREVSEYSAFSPDFLAIEPPELIGSGRAVSKAKPEVITESVESARSVDDHVRVICGAGIVTGEDVEAALNLGSKGILVASGVVKASSWREKIYELAKPFTKIG